MNIPHPPLGPWVESLVEWIKTDLSALLKFFTDLFNNIASGFSDAMGALPPLVLVVILALIAASVRSLWFGLFTLVGGTLIVSMEVWPQALDTLSMVIVATLVAVIIAVPLGILAAKSSVVSQIVRPILDFLQTMPALVYLVPVVIFFSIGFAPGVVATIIFSLAPGVRLTELGIRQVDKETVEAGEAFGGTGWQILRGIQLPLGLPTIMAGVNQVIMLGLSMAVLAGFVGAPGLGKVVTEAQGRVDVGTAFEAGLAIVILAIFLDRVTGAIGQSMPKSIVSMVRRHRAAKIKAEEEAAAEAASTAQESRSGKHEAPEEKDGSEQPVPTP